MVVDGLGLAKLQQQHHAHIIAASSSFSDAPRLLACLHEQRSVAAQRCAIHIVHATGAACPPPQHQEQRRPSGLLLVEPNHHSGPRFGFLAVEEPEEVGVWPAGAPFGSGCFFPRLHLAHVVTRFGGPWGSGQAPYTVPRRTAAAPSAQRRPPRPPPRLRRWRGGLSPRYSPARRPTAPRLPMAPPQGRAASERALEAVCALGLETIPFFALPKVGVQASACWRALAASSQGKKLPLRRPRTLGGNASIAIVAAAVIVQPTQGPVW